MTRRIWEVEYAGSPKTLWSEVKPTDAQLAVAAKLGIQVFPEDTYAAVAATILEAVGDVIGCPPREVSGRQYDLAEELGIDVSDCTSSWVAFVRIQEAIQIANVDAVHRMDLTPGNRVVKTVERGEHLLSQALGEVRESLAERSPREFEVSSIREDGQVFFKGGEQAPARYLEKIATSGQDSRRDT